MKSKIYSVLLVFTFLNIPFAYAATLGVMGTEDKVDSSPGIAISPAQIQITDPITPNPTTVHSSVPVQANASEIAVTETLQTNQTTQSIQKSSNCERNSNCGWCGDTCAPFEQNRICPAVMPPQDYSCICNNGNCIKEKKTPIPIHMNATIIQNTTISYNGEIRTARYYNATSISTNTTSITTTRNYTSQNGGANVVVSVNQTSSNNNINIVAVNNSESVDYNGNIVVIKNYTPVNYNGTIISQNYTTSATLNMSPVFEMMVEGVRLKEQNISSITVINATTYDIKSIKKKKLFGILPIDVDLKIRIDSDTYKVINMEKPWWSFLTT